MDIKENFATNLTRFRKTLGLTQVDLAEKINYSDKAVSKWERGESIPDAYTLKQIADFFHVTIDELISPPKEKNPVLKVVKNIKWKRTILICAIISLVWLVSVFAFSLLEIVSTSISNTWLAFIYSIPVSMIILLVFTCIWKSKTGKLISETMLVWSLILAVYLTLLLFLPTPPVGLWKLFLIGIPLQVLIIFWSVYKK